MSTTPARITPGALLLLAAEVVEDDDFTGGKTSGHPIDALAVASAALECVAITLYRWEAPE